MRITLRLLKEELSAFYPHILIGGRETESLRAVMPLPEKPEHIQLDCLYCCGADRAFAELPEDVCFLLVGQPVDALPKNYLLVSEEADEQTLLIRVQNILLRLWSWYAEILRICARSTDFQALVDASEPLFPQGLSVLSVYHNRLFSSSNSRYERTGRWKTLVRSYYEPDTTAERLPFDLVEQLHSQRGPHILSMRGEGTNYLVCNIFLEGIRIGNIIAPVKDRCVKSSQFMYMEELMHCAEQMFEAAQGEDDDPLTGTILRLLSGERILPEELHSLCAAAGWTEQGHTFRISVIHANANAKTQFRSGQLLFRNIISAIYCRSKVLIFGEDIVLVRDFTANDASAEGEDSLRRLRYFLRQIHAVMGSSIPFSELLQLRVFYEQAKTVALALEKPDAAPCDYASYLPYDMINSFADGHVLKHYIHPEILKLAEQNPKGSTGLLLSLYYYLLNDRSYQLCAEKQHIHRNSFAYRIGKVLSALHCDLSDENTRLSLLLSICMFWYIHPEIDPVGISRWRNH